MKYKLMGPIIKDYSAMEQIFYNRGVPKEKINNFLNSTDNDLHDPFLLDRVKDGIKTLMFHIAQGHIIFIQVDPDVDGFTSASYLINYLYKVFPDFTKNNIIYDFQHGKHHGLIVEKIPKDAKLVIAPDSSSNDYAIHKQLRENGIDVLVLDHHEADKISDDAIVINNQLCHYPNKALSGVGIVYKFCKAIDNLMGLSYSEDFVDLVALGLIGDMMNLSNIETKHLVQKGIKNIKNPFFLGLVEKNAYSIGSPITPFSIAFYVAPLINAVVRVGSQEDKKTVFRAMLEYDAFTKVPSTKRGETGKGKEEWIVTQALRVATNCKSRQTKSRDSAAEKIKKQIKEESLLDNKILTIKLDDGSVDKNITGLIANQLMAEYQRPVLLLHKVEDDEKTFWRGSGRGYDKSDFDDLKGFLNESGLTEYAQGHANAMGVSIEDTNFKEFIDYSEVELDEFTFESGYSVDFIYTQNEITKENVLDISSLKIYWGKGFEESFIAIKGVKVTKDNLFLLSKDKKPTIKIVLPNGIELIKFKSSEEEYLNLLSEGYVSIDVVGSCDVNIYYDKITPQIKVLDYEITGKKDYYF